MAFDESLRLDVLKHADIVKVISSFLPLIKKGKNYWAVCPFHDDTHPSMSVSPEKQMFKCFVCGTGGDAISFVEKYQHISYFEALKKVAEISGYSDPRLEKNQFVTKVDERKETLLKCLKDLSIYYQFALNTEEGKEGLDYFESRHLDIKMRQKYLLGFASKDGVNTIKFLQSKGHSLKTIEDVGVSILRGNEYYDRNQGRAIFPICDADGNVVGFSARRIVKSDEAKYVNSPETYVFTKSNILYNYHIAKEKARVAGCLYVLEGFMDVFALAKIGMDNAVAIMGTALTKEHIQMLRSLNVEIRLCLDGDLPGQTAMLKASKMLEEEGLNFSIVDNQNSSKDPDEILNEDGEEALKSYLNNTLSRVDFALKYYKNSNPLKTIEQKKSLVERFLPILANIRSQLELDSYLRRLSEVTSFEVESIRSLLKKYREMQRNSENGEVSTKNVMKNYHPERKLLQRLLLAEEQMLYQMLNSKKAVAFYENHIKGFYDETYRHLANYICNFVEENKEEELEPRYIISEIASSDDENKENLINALTDLCVKDKYPVLGEELWEDLYQTIYREREKIFNEDTLKASLNGKDELEKARIMTEYNRQREKKMNK